MNILISHVYSAQNRGDAAILSAQISQLKQNFKNANLNILTVDTVPKGYTFDDVPVSRALMYDAVAPHGNRLEKLIIAAVMLIYTSLWSVIYRFFRLSLPLPVRWRYPMNLLIKSDMAVGVGGGYLRAKDDFSSTFILVLLFHQFWVAKLLKKPIYLYAQSFGPYPTWIQRKIASFSLKKVDLILVREDQSKKLLEELGIVKNVKYVPDSAFLFEPRIDLSAVDKVFSTSTNKQTIGITVRDWLGGKGREQYERAMSGFIDYLSQNRQFSVIVIPQVTSTLQNDDDRLIGDRIKQLLNHSEKVIFLDNQLSHYEVRAIIGKLNYLIGTRFHSVIFALSAGVPAIGIEYEHKTSGIMGDLGLEDWVIDIEDVTTQKLITLFKQLQKQRSSYVKQLQDILPNYKRTAEQGVKLIKQAYERRLELQNDSEELG